MTGIFLLLSLRDLINVIHCIHLSPSGPKCTSRAQQRDHVTPILVELQWLIINFDIDFKIVLITFKAFHCLPPSYISELLSFNQQPHSLRSGSRVLLPVPRSKRKLKGDLAFAIRVLSTLEQPFFCPYGKCSFIF